MSLAVAIEVVASGISDLQKLLRVEQLANWAAEDGDPDVLAICQLALAGDRAMLDDALEWWPAWAETHGGAS